MRKLVLFIIMFISLKTAHSQFGERVGFSLTNIDFETFDYNNQRYSPSEKYSWGIHTGIFRRFTINHLFLQPELLMTINSCYIDIYDSNVNKTMNQFNLKFNLPLIVGYKISFFDLHLGPSIDYNCASMASIDNSDYASYWDFPNKFNLNFQAGLGFTFGSLIISLKYEKGLIKYQQKVRELYSDNELNFKSLNNQIILSIGYSNKKLY